MKFKTNLIISALFISNFTLAQNGEELYQQAREAKHYSKNYPLAFTLAQQSCDLGNMNGCNFLGGLYEQGKGVKQNYRQAIELFVEACSAGNTKGCLNLGRLYYQGLGGLKQDIFQAKNLFEKSCKGGLAGGCAGLGEFYRDQKKYLEAKRYYQIACDNKDTYSCNELGRIYHNNKDYLLAKRYFEKACYANYDIRKYDGGMEARSYGCRNLGMLYDHGLGVNKDPIQARRLYGKACDLGNQEACKYK